MRNRGDRPRWILIAYASGGIWTFRRESGKRNPVAVPTDNGRPLEYTVGIMIIRLLVIIALALLSVIGLIVLGRLAEDRHD